MSGAHPLLGCACPLCHTWRRVGFLLARSDTGVLFRDWALRRVREFYTEVLDAAEGFALVPGPPVSAGGPVPTQPEGEGASAPRAPPVNPPEGGAVNTPEVLPGESPLEGPRSPVGPAQATCKAGVSLPPPGLTQATNPGAEAEGAAEPRSSSARVRETATKSPLSVKRSPPREKKKKKDKKHKKAKPKEEESEVKREASAPKIDVDYSRASESQVSEEETLGEQEEEIPRGPPEEPRKRAPAVERGSRERGRIRSRDRRGDRTPHRRSRSRSRRRPRNSRSRGRRDRSPRSRARGGHNPPPEPLGPPPTTRPTYPPPGRFYQEGWWNRSWGSKGVKRRARAEDIRAYGPDPERKYQREQWQRGR